MHHFCSHSQVISEGLRLRPIVGNAFKVTTEDTTLYGYRVPKGWSFNLDYRAVMCRDSYFPQADQFRPERFDVSERNERIDGNTVSEGHRCGSSVFGVGWRDCDRYLCARIGALAS